MKNSKLQQYLNITSPCQRQLTYCTSVSPQEKTIPSSLKTHITDYRIDIQPGILSLDSPGPITNIIRTFSSKI